MGTIGKALAGAILAGLSIGGAAASDQQTRPESVAPKLTPAGNAATAERVALLVEQRYLVPQLGRRYAAAVRRMAATGAYAAITDRNILAERITTDLQAVHPDGHLHLWPTVVDDPHPADRAPMTRAEALTKSGEVEPGIVAMNMAAPGVAYINFHYFSDDAEALSKIDGFLRDHAGANALIIDSRENSGGMQPMLAELSNRLFGTERHLVNMDIAAATVAQHGQPFHIDGRSMRRGDGPPGLVRFEHWAVPARDAPGLFTIPVYYLTSHKTFSAAEHMAFVLKITHRATLVGETTGGGNHFGGTEDVGSGLELFVPIGRTSDPKTNRDWEGVGVAPDIAVPADQALKKALELARSGRRPDARDDLRHRNGSNSQ